MRSEVPPALAAARSSYRSAAKAPARTAEHLRLLSRVDPVAPVEESLSPARALRTQPCQRAAAAPSSIAWTRPQIQVQDPKALYRLYLPAPATKQEPPTKGPAPGLGNLVPFFFVFVVCGVG